MSEGKTRQPSPTVIAELLDVHFHQTSVISEELAVCGIPQCMT